MSVRRRGFTLLEVIVTIAVIGLIAALVAPAVGRSTAKQAERRALMELSGVFLAQRVEAIDAGATATVTLRAGEGALRASSTGGGERVWKNWRAPLMHASGERREEARVEFGPRGRADVEALWFTGPEGSDRMWQIRFDPIAGTPALVRGGETNP